jgi:serine/threonine protein kinase
MIGENLGSYRVVRKIGEGGMGAVYLAEHTLLQRKAAVKVLLPAFSNDEEVVQRFFNEAKATNAIAHPAIVQVFDVGNLKDGRAYLIMEFLEGESLDARLKRLGRLSVSDALRITVHCASALAAAHQAGIVHRDLKPENIFLIPDPQVDGGERAKVLDFGIAKLTDDRQSGSVKTRTGSVMGTPTYMAPEQCRGAGEIDHRADIYALGCVLFHLLCGRPPFVGQGLGDILVAQMREPAPWARTFNPEVPAGVDEALQRALAKAPEARFTSMAEFAAALAAGSGQNISPRVSWGQSTPAPSAANPGYTPAPGSYPGHGSYPPGSQPGTGSYPGTGSQPGHGSYPGTGSMMGTGPRNITGSTLGAAAAQNLTHGTMAGNRRRRAMIIGLVAVATTVGGILAVVMGGESGGAEDIPVLQPLQEPSVAANPQPGAATGAATGTTPGTTTDPAGNPATGPEIDPSGTPEIEIEPTPAEPAPIAVEVTSQPAGAKVFAPDSTEPLGVTPYSYEAPSSPDRITLRLELDGYKPAEVSFPGDRNGVAQLVLQKAAKRSDGKRPRNPSPDDEFGYR